MCSNVLVGNSDRHRRDSERNRGITDGIRRDSDRLRKFGWALRIPMGFVDSDGLCRFRWALQIPMGFVGSDRLRIARTNRRSQRAYRREFEVDSDAWSSIVFSSEAPSAWLDSDVLASSGSCIGMREAVSDHPADRHCSALKMLCTDSSSSGPCIAVSDSSLPEQVIAANPLPAVSSNLIWPPEPVFCIQLSPPSSGWQDSIDMP